MPDPLVEVISKEALHSRVTELGAQIASDYHDRRPILVGILRGAVPFLADLVRTIEADLEVDFLALSRFGRGGRVHIAMDTETSLTGRDVLLVEDIVDTGLTLVVLRRLLSAREAASVATVTLLDRAVRRVVDVPVEYRGFEVGDEYLVGYGLDRGGRYRNLPSVWVYQAGFARPDVHSLSTRQ